TEGIPANGELPDGSRHGQNDFFEIGYGGPCPPNSQTHDYHFTLYAVDIVLNLKSGTTKDVILKAIDGHILAQTELIGRYASP
ncbi:MAG: YbhB/YbcL family Raf kinase inhibitor-like protein, partial [Pontiellaceae bacterium]|nr:YbhB/YbcL family Raf kinase inhibitor-like protein [Pontiellaceae bacterium]